MVLPTGGRKPGIPGQSRNELTDRILALGSTLEPIQAMDEGQEVVKGPSGIVSVISRVNAAAYSTLANALAAGEGKTIYVPPGSYGLTAALTPAAGTTIELHPNAVLEQQTAWTPIWDILGVDDVTVMGGQYEWNGPREFNPNGTIRWSGGYDMSSALWTNGHRTRFIGAKVFGFMRAMFASGFNGVDFTPGRTRDVVMEDIEIDTVTSALVAAGTTNIRVHNVRGSFTPFEDVGLTTTPAHLLYFSESGVDHTTNVNPTISDCYAASASGDTASYAYQFKGISGGSARGLHAGSVPQLLHIMDARDFTVEDFTAQECTSTSGYAVSLEASSDEDIQRVRVRRGSLSNVTNGQKVVDLRGTDNLVSDVIATVSTPSEVQSLGLALVRGTRNHLDQFHINETGAGEHTTVISEGTNSLITNPVANRAPFLVRVTGGTATVQYDPDRSTTTWAALVRMTAGASARVMPTETRRTLTLSGSTATPNPTRSTSSVVVVTGATVTIAAPPQFCSITGMQHTIEMYNTSGGAIATTWDAIYILASAWVEPPSGERRFITFLFDGTNWVEVSRSG